jgi:hypothetical protein
MCSHQIHLIWNAWNDIRKPYRLQLKAKINSEILTDKTERIAVEKKRNIRRRKTEITINK